eukprot:m.117942 g.117942  ORF g.117942 m.117942 type:complete len:57 (-) comp28618_c1_seq1:42-212(-)
MVSLSTNVFGNCSTNRHRSIFKVASSREIFGNDLDIYTNTIQSIRSTDYQVPGYNM